MGGPPLGEPDRACASPIAPDPMLAAPVASETEIGPREEVAAAAMLLEEPLPHCRPETTRLRRRCGGCRPPATTLSVRSSERVQGAVRAWLASPSPSA